MKTKLQCVTNQGNPECSEEMEDWDLPKTNLTCPGFTGGGRQLEKEAAMS